MDHFSRMAYKQYFEFEFLKYQEWYYQKIGEDTPEEIIPCILNFDDCLLDTKVELPEIISNRFELISDDGIEFRKYGDASGGDFGTTDYRVFDIFDKKLNNEFISGFSISSTGKTFNDPKYGNQTGKSVLTLIYNDDKIDRFAVQINLNKFLTVTYDKKATFKHNAFINVQGGGQKKEDLLKYVQENNKKLVGHNEIHLGTIDYSVPLTLENPDVIKLISNMIEYSVYVIEYKLSVIQKQNRKL